MERSGRNKGQISGNFLNRKTMRKMKRQEKKTKKDFFYKHHLDKAAVEKYNKSVNNIRGYKKGSQANTYTKDQGEEYSEEEENYEEESENIHLNNDDDDNHSNSEEIDSDLASGSEDERNEKPLVKIHKKVNKTSVDTPLEDDLDKDIKRLEKKLGLKDAKRRERFKNSVANENYDDDLFDFLDNIEKIVRKDKTEDSYAHQEEEEEVIKIKKDNSAKKQNISPVINKQEDLTTLTTLKTSLPQSRLFFSLKLSEANKLKLSFQKDVTSILNKISEANLTLLFPEFLQKIETLEKTQISHNQTLLTIYETLSKVALKMTLDNPTMNLPITSCICAYISVLHFKFGNSFFLFFLRSLYDRINPEFLNKEPQAETRSILKNFIFLIIPFFIFGNLGSKFYFDLISFFIQNFNPLFSEILLILLSYLGIEIRKEDPEALKFIIAEVNKKHNLIKLEGNVTTTGKLKYIVDMIDDIKNNKYMKFNLIEKFNFFKTFVNHNKKAYTEAELNLTDSKFLADKVEITWSELISINKEDINEDSNKHSSKNTNNSLNDMEKLISVDTNINSKQLEEKMRKFKMTTDLKKMIFTAVASSSDCNDAFERLTRLNLKRDQQREIVKIVILLAREESSFNPFYKLLLSKLISCEKDHKYTFHYSIWDQMKAMASEKNFGLKKIHNLGKLVGSLLAEEKVSLPVFLNFQFEEADANTRNFLITSLDYYFEKVQSVDKSKLLFAKLVKNDDHVEFARRLFYFLIRGFKEKLNLDKKDNKDNTGNKDSVKSESYMTCYIAATKVLKRIL